MRRALLNSAAALSMLLCAATVILWTRSYRHLDDIGLYPTARQYWLLRSAEGRIYFQHTGAGEPIFKDRHTQYTTGELARLRYENLPFNWRIAGFACGRQTFAFGGVTFSFHFCQLPHAGAAAFFAIAPAWWFRTALRRHRARVRRAAGRCAACGYDLRASPARCPECGADVAAAAATAAAAARPGAEPSTA